MELAVFGATGGTGRELTAQASNRGHDIRVLTRSPATISTGSALTTVEGNVLDPDAVSATIEGVDAVCCLLGRTPNNPDDIVSRGTARIIAAMERHGVERLVVLTSMGLGSSTSAVPWYVRLANATVLADLMADKARQEERVMQSDLDWTIVRPGGLTDEPGTGEYVHGVDTHVTAGPIPRADVAEFLLWVIETEGYVHETPSLTTRRDIDIEFLWDQATGVARRVVG
ncbi:NAD(P)-dependent oxidoreductase [Haloarcula sp. Atlit-7R]|uniref:NAD(P)-dependent oxidoreductase n=1 Tax=Haloarcula sp. Atlit-7R TaxID=2282125 RepID=UPI000EF1432C|nr:NAD(P)-binding oxidoreductase [Haloarcula sp. Atlit-7R]RLM91115.1 NAD-dependent epimerase/dehydratase family protein [Haloarcula sp. Atlit-7R]